MYLKKSLNNNLNKVKNIWKIALGLFLLFPITALTLLYSGFQPVRAATDFSVEVAINEGEPILVINLNPRTDPETQDRPEYEFTVKVKNLVAFEQSDIPLISIEDFDSLNEEGGVRFLTTEQAKEYEFGASTWIDGPQRLTDLEDQASQELEDFSIDVPNDQAAGSYTAAIVLRNTAGDNLGYHLVIINIGNEEDTTADLELVKGDTKIDLVDLENTKVTLNNGGDWHIYPLVKIILADSQTDKSMEVVLEQKEVLGILPSTQQVFSLAEGENNDLDDFISSAEALEATIVVLNQSSADEEELKRFENLDLTVAQTESESESEADNSDQEASDQQSQASTTTPIDESETNFLEDNLLYIVGAGIGILILSLVLVLLLKRRKPKNKTTLKVDENSTPPLKPEVGQDSTNQPAQEALKGMPDLPSVDVNAMPLIPGSSPIPPSPPPTDSNLPQPPLASNPPSDPNPPSSVSNPPSDPNPIPPPTPNPPSDPNPSPPPTPNPPSDPNPPPPPSINP